jgi:hypothetical protein
VVRTVKWWSGRAGAPPAPGVRGFEAQAPACAEHLSVGHEVAIDARLRFEELETVARISCHPGDEARAELRFDPSAVADMRLNH